MQFPVLVGRSPVTSFINVKCWYSSWKSLFNWKSTSLLNHTNPEYYTLKLTILSTIEVSNPYFFPIIETVVGPFTIFQFAIWYHSPWHVPGVQFSVHLLAFPARQESPRRGAGTRRGSVVQCFKIAGGFHQWGIPNSWMVSMENPKITWMINGSILPWLWKPPAGIYGWNWTWPVSNPGVLSGARSPGCPPVSITRFAGKSTIEFGDESHPRKRWQEGRSITLSHCYSKIIPDLNIFKQYEVRWNYH